MRKHSSGYCLNCEEQLGGAYCSRCGQRAVAHRLSIRHFITHEVIHGVWHLDKGILYTLKALLTRPGRFAAAYIAGKRAGHFNLGTLLILLAALLLYLTPGVLFSGIKFKFYDQDGAAFMKFAQASAKWMLLVIVPVMAKISFDIFRRLNYNYTEHLVMNGFFFAGAMCILIFFSLLRRVVALDTLLLASAAAVCCVVYLVVCYRQATAGYYPRGAFVLRMLLYLTALPFYTAGIYFAAIVVYYSLVTRI